MKKTKQNGQTLVKRYCLRPVQTYSVWLECASAEDPGTRPSPWFGTWEGQVRNGEQEKEAKGEI